MLVNSEYRWNERIVEIWLVYSVNRFKINSVDSRSFSAQRRKTSLQYCENNSPDVIIVGGGITGAGALLEATRRGLKAILLEKNDFASGTSSASSKLIHGGLRYLEMMDLGLVFESCMDRKRLLEMAPRLVQPLEFTFPVYKGQRRGLWTIYAGTWLYYFLALFRNIGSPQKDCAEKTLAKLPKLNRRELTGSIRYFDASTMDTRLTLATIKTACSFGAHAVNHANVVEYTKEGDRITGVVVEDRISGEKSWIHSPWIIQATGAWTESNKLRLTKGVHMILEGNPFQIDTAIDMLSPVDGRVLFIIPWCGHTLVGTTDTDYHGDADHVRVEKNDLEYLFKAIQFYFPTVTLTRESILSCFAGLRCLKRQEELHPSEVSREHMMYSDAPGKLTIMGGKLTTYLSMSEQIIDWLFEHQPDWKKRKKIDIDQIDSVTPMIELKSPTEKLFKELIQQEMAVTVRDLLQYRCMATLLTKDNGASLIEMASRAIKTELGLTDQQVAEQVQEYNLEIEKHRAP